MSVRNEDIGSVLNRSMKTLRKNSLDLILGCINLGWLAFLILACQTVPCVTWIQDETLSLNIKLNHHDGIQGCDTLYTNNQREIVSKLLYIIQMKTLIKQHAQPNKYRDY